MISVSYDNHSSALDNAFWELHPYMHKLHIAGGQQSYIEDVYKYWVAEFFGGVMLPTKDGPMDWIINFENDEDAVAFKLKFGV